MGESKREKVPESTPSAVWGRLGEHKRERRMSMGRCSTEGVPVGQEFF